VHGHAPPAPEQLPTWDAQPGDETNAQSLFSNPSSLLGWAVHQRVFLCTVRMHLFLLMRTARTEEAKCRSCMTACVVVFIKVSFLGVKVGCSPERITNFHKSVLFTSIGILFTHAAKV
jgi:hypothetical protein